MESLAIEKWIVSLTHQPTLKVIRNAITKESITVIADLIDQKESKVLFR